MSKIFKLYNLNFLFANGFEPFTVDGYAFYPIKNMSQTNKIESSDDVLRFNRKMHFNAYVSIPARQKDSIFRRTGKYSKHRKIKFLDDLLTIISIFIGRNVVPRFYYKFSEFPTFSAKHCEIISKNSIQLKTHLELAISKITKDDWQQKYENGFHVIKFYNASNITIAEPRFLADVTIWEFLYHRNNSHLSYDQMRRISLNTKINDLVKKCFLNNDPSIPEDRFRIFSDIRNQLSHNGKFEIQNPRSPFRNLGWIGLRHYIDLFKRLTQVLVLKTMGIDSIDQMSIFSVRQHFEELYQHGHIRHYEEMDKAGIYI